MNNDNLRIRLNRPVKNATTGIKLIGVLLGLLLVTSVATAADKPEPARRLPRVLLIGDSICDGYHKSVVKALAGKAIVVKASDNGRDTLHGLEKLDEWLGRERWDVIHFNWGLWDIAHRLEGGGLDKAKGKIICNTRNYQRHLEALVKRLRLTGAMLIWASTTPVPEGDPGRIKGDAVKYNALAAKIMNSNDVAINDLYKVAADKGFGKTADVHNLPDLSTSVIASVEKALSTFIPPPNSFSFKAIDFNRGNIKVRYEGRGFADIQPVTYTPKPIWRQKKKANIEYDVTFPIDATYKLQIRYALREIYPVELWVDGKKVADNICNVSRNSNESACARWGDICTLPLKAGKHTFRMHSPRFIPHMTDWRFVSDRPFPKGWKFERPKRALESREYVECYGGYLRKAPVKIETNELAALKRAIDDLIKKNPDNYPRGAEFLERLATIQTEKPDSPQRRKKLDLLKRDVLLANPLLDFSKILLVRRKSVNEGLPQNYESNSSLKNLHQMDDALMTLSLDQAKKSPGDIPLEMVFQTKKKYLGQVDLHFNADKILFSSQEDKQLLPTAAPRWQIYEMDLKNRVPRAITGGQPEVDNYDACYMPSGKIAFTSTASFTGVPCLYGSPHVANLYIMDGDGKNIRQIGFDQDHSWSPSVLNNGRLIYQRWEYTDTPHTYARLLFHCNPDGTNQVEYYGSNSYWPNAMFYARAIPGHPTKVVAIVGGHHDLPRQGELVIFDPALGRHEADGAVQRIPGYGKKIEPIIKDQLTKLVWPKFLHPYPLSETTFLVACRPSPQSLWGIYLVDTFDNMLLLKEEQKFSMLEPLPLRKTKVPPVIPDRVDLTRQDATVFINNIYTGPGLKDVKPGSVKQLRIFTYNYGFRNIGGLPGVVGNDGPWDIKEVLGTVPVKADGSACFTMPANTPVSIQPLDANGAALQIMRSWFTAMPGEVVSCVGCHERQNTTAGTTKATLAMKQPKPDQIAPWRGPRRGFSFNRDVQVVLDKYCLGCHNGKPRKDGLKLKDFSANKSLVDFQLNQPGCWMAVMHKRGKDRFTEGYFALQSHVRRSGIESDYHLLEPMEFHASTTELVQMLKKGHHGVKLNAEAWDRLYTWIDLNCPFYGTWGEASGGTRPGKYSQMRLDMRKLYTNIDKPHNPDKVYQTVTALSGDPIIPTKPQASTTAAPTCKNWPFNAATAKAMQAQAAPDGKTIEKVIELADGVKIRFVRIPAGAFIMGTPNGPADEPVAKASVDKAFWMGVCEITNAQYAAFDPKHDSRVEPWHTIQFGSRGFPMNEPTQPVIRVTQDRAVAFCRWLSTKTGKTVTLPSEVQWEWACRAGTDTPFWYGDLDSDFSKAANFSDTTMTKFVVPPYSPASGRPTPLSPYEDWIPKDARSNDGSLVTVAPGKYQANAWGLCDMHGNAAEWTRSSYDASRKVVRGGSWYTRPLRGTSSYRWGYLPRQRVYDVGFRVIIE